MISVDQPLRLNHFKFYVQGKENPLKSVQDSAQDWYSERVRDQYSGRSSGDSSSPYKSSNIFFYKDLMDSFRSSGIEISNEGEGEFKKGEWNIPFRFTIPGDTLESYDGIDASIVYDIVAMPGAIFDRLHNRQEFTVVNPNYQGGINGKTVRFDGRPIISDSENSERGKKVRLVIEDDKTNFSPGDTIRGRIILPSENSNNRKRLRIKKAEITLSPAITSKCINKKYYGMKMMMAVHGLRSIFPMRLEGKEITSENLLPIIGYLKLNLTQDGFII